MKGLHKMGPKALVRLANKGEVSPVLIALWQRNGKPNPIKGAEDKIRRSVIWKRIAFWCGMLPIAILLTNAARGHFGGTYFLGDGSYGIIYGLALVTTAMYFHLRIDDGESRFGHYLEELQRFTGISYRELTAHDEWSIRGVAEEALVAKAQEVLELRQANMNTPRVHWEAKEAQLAHEFEWRHTVTTALGLASGPFGKYYDAARDRLGSEG